MGPVRMSCGETQAQAHTCSGFVVGLGASGSVGHAATAAPEWLQGLAQMPRACQILLLFACTICTPSWLQTNITVGNCVLMLEQADHYKMQKLSEVGSFALAAL